MKSFADMEMERRRAEINIQNNEKFVKMKKMLPEGAVRQKMKLEGFTDEETKILPLLKQRLATQKALLATNEKRLTQDEKILEFAAGKSQAKEAEQAIDRISNT
jgi:hypothetical protein